MRTKVGSLVVCGALCACTPTEHPPTPTASVAPARVEPLDATGWERMLVEPAGIELTVPAAAEITSGTYRDLRYLYVSSSDPPLVIGVLRREGEDIEGWPWAAGLVHGGGLSFGPETAVRVCSRWARRREVAAAEEAAEAVEVDDHGNLGHSTHVHPARVAVRVLLREDTREDTQEETMVSWLVERSDRERLHAWEQRFFAAIACPGG